MIYLCASEITIEVPTKQLLDYAANGVTYWPPQEIVSRFERTCERADADAEGVLEEFLDDEQDVEDFWATVATNLRAGRVRLVFVADQIPSELGRIVAFLNEQMSPAEVLGVEVRQYTGQGQRALVPRLVGRTAAGRGHSRRQPDPGHVAFLTAVHEFAEQRLRTSGWHDVILHKDRIRLKLPPRHPLRESRGAFRAPREALVFRFVVEAGSREASVRAVDLLRERYGDQFTAELPQRSQIEWHQRRDNGDAVVVTRSGGGWLDLDPREAAEWAVSVCGAWIQLLKDRNDPPHDLIEQARADVEDDDEGDGEGEGSNAADED